MTKLFWYHLTKYSTKKNYESHWSITDAIQCILKMTHIWDVSRGEATGKKLQLKWVIFQKSTCSRHYFPSWAKKENNERREWVIVIEDADKKNKNNILKKVTKETKTYVSHVCCKDQAKEDFPHQFLKFILIFFLSYVFFFVLFPQNGVVGCRLFALKSFCVYSEQKTKNRYNRTASQRQFINHWINTTPPPIFNFLN